MTFIRQLIVQQWKIILLQKHRLLLTILDILIPVFFLIVAIQAGALFFNSGAGVGDEASDMHEAKKKSGNLVYDRYQINTFYDSERPNSSLKILYSPSSNLTTKLMNKAVKILAREITESLIIECPKFRENDAEEIFSNVSKNVLGKGFDSKYSLENKLQEGTYHYGIQFPSFERTRTATDLPKCFKYLIIRDMEHYSNTKTPTTLGIKFPPTIKLPGPESGDSMTNFKDKAVLLMQWLLAVTYIDEIAELKTASFNVRIEKMPEAPEDRLFFVSAVRLVLSIVIPLYVLVPVIFQTIGIVEEKEKRLLEFSKMIGLNSAVHWASWFIHGFVILAIIMIIVICQFFIKFWDIGALFELSSPTLFFFFAMEYSAAVLCLSFCVSAIFKRPALAATIASILVVGAIGIDFTVNSYYYTFSAWAKWLLCLHYSTAFAIGLRIMNELEIQGFGATWDKVATQPLGGNFTLGYCMLMLLIDTVIFLLITWYISNVWPGEYGVPQPVCFCFMKTYWAGRSNEGHDEQIQTAPMLKKYFAPKPSLPVGIKICSLQKDFSSVKAVNISDLEVYQGEIFVLLGHNGAGKTTTMSILSGFIPPSSGTAYLNGLDIRYNLKEVRKNLGLCPQFSVYFDTLTVEEHLLYFAKLQGNTGQGLKSDVQEMISNVGLKGKERAQAKTLSGGQQRKLSVAISFINRSKIVILDEPSSGMDPEARHQMWDFLRGQKEGRTILLSTHYMDEADALGDRIAIMAQSMVICCGPPMFLKKLFGAGSHLTIDRSPDCDVDKVTGFIETHMPSATLESRGKLELTYTLPNYETHLIPSLLRRIEENKTELGIRDYGASAITMEEVFLNVGKNVAAVLQQTLTDSKEDVGNRYLSQQDFNVDKVNEKDDSVDSSSKTIESTSFKSSEVDSEKPSVITSETTSEITREGTSKYSGVTTSNVDQPEATKQGRTQDISGNALSASEAYISQDALEEGALKHPKYEKLTGGALIWSRAYGLFLKRLIVTVRSPMFLFVQIFLTPLLLLLRFAGSSEASGVDNTHYVDFNLDGYEESTIAYSVTPQDDKELVDLAKRYTNQFSGKHEVIEQTNVTQFLEEEALRLGKYRYGYQYLLGAKFYKDDNGTITVMALHNSLPYNSPPISLNYILSGLAKYYGTDENEIQTSLSLLFSGEEKKPSSKRDNDALFFILINLFGLTLVCANFLVLLAKERLSGSKHLQILSGSTPLMYWGIHLIVNFFIFLVPILLSLVIVRACKVDLLSDMSIFPSLSTLMIFYWWAFVPYMMCMEAPFQSPATAMLIGFIYHFIIPLGTVFYYGNSISLNKYSSFDLLFSIIFPNHAVGVGIAALATQFNINHQCWAKNYKILCLTEQMQCCKNYGKGCKTRVCDEVMDDYLGTRGIGIYLILLGLQGAIFILLRVSLEHHLFQRLYTCFQNSAKTQQSVRPSAELTGEDEDVARERKRINESPPSQPGQEDALVLVNLYKRFGDLVAVDDISVGIEKDECFGLLGQNGAGKTTTFKMIIGSEMVSRGDIYLNGLSIRQHLTKVQSGMGYCPQFDALIDEMTGGETLYMYARLRGLPAHKIKPCVDTLVEKLDLKQHVDKLTKNMSGGNKRKLSTAIALIGDPPLILLDEPSSGMDPGARIHMWQVLSAVRASGKTLILTSHSMEECEALCTRITIMMKGRMVCLGSLQHIKSKFAQGYTILVKMAKNDMGEMDAVAPAVDRIKNKFPSAYIFTSNEGFAHLQVPDPEVQLADVFEVLENCKQDLNLEDYSVQQTSLEQVFLKLTHDLSQPDPSKPPSCLHKMCCCCCD